MIAAIPGTQKTLSGADSHGDVLGILAPIAALGGLSLSQVTELTGLQASTIQNWVKRGWVSNPVEKRYSDLQVARVLIINTLRHAMKLTQIADLLRYVNGRVEDRSDDIISDCELYNHLCVILMKMDHKQSVSKESIRSLVEKELADYAGPVPDARERLVTALTIMLLAYISAALRSEANRLMKQAGIEEVERDSLIQNPA